MSDPPTPRRRWQFWSAMAALIVIALPLLAVVLLLGALNTGPGQRAAERLTTRLTGGTVRIAGLHGMLPQAPRLDSLELRDAKGTWLTAQGIALDWSPTRLIGLDASVQALTVARIDILRRPLPGAPARKPSRPFRLPVAVDADRIGITTLVLSPPVAGTAAQLAAGGSAHLRSLTRGTIALTLSRIDVPGTYTVAATLGDTLQAHLTAQEPPHGLIATAARLPDLGALGLDATLAGPTHAAALRLALAAGALRADASGTLDIDSRAADIALSAQAPAMTLAPGLGWRSIALSGHLNGPLRKPNAEATIDIATLTANGNGVGHVTGHVTADTHTAALTAQLQDITLAAPNQTLLQDGPLTLQARLDLDAPTRPVTYSFDQAVLHGSGTAVLAPQLATKLVVTLPSLAILARARGRDVQGSAGLTLAVARNQEATRIDIDAALAVTGGADAPPAARGQTTLGATVTLADMADPGADITLSRLHLAGTTVNVDATGQRRSGRISAQWHLVSADLHDLSPRLRGALTMTGQLAGTQQDFAADATLDGTLGTATLAPAPVRLSVHGTGLPTTPAGHVTGSATLDGADLALDIDATRDADRTLHVAINRADWKSAALSGGLTLAPGATLPVGTLKLAMARLDELRPLVGHPVTGSLVAALTLPPGAPGTLHLDARNAGLPGKASVARAVLDATVRDLAGHPVIAGTLAATGLKAGAISGDVRLAANGPGTALALRLDAGLHGLAGADAGIQAAALLDATARTLRIGSVAATWHGEALALAAPATLSYAPQVAVDRLRLVVTTPGARPASLELAGRISPDLALTITGRDITPTLGKPFAPSLDADGVVRLDARLGGTPALPTGTVRLAATGLRLRSGPARGLPPTDMTANAALAGGLAHIDVGLAAGTATHLTASGTVPLTSGGVLALHAGGTMNLVMLDPILTPQGRRMRGAATLDATIAGTTAAPRVTGDLRLADGEFQDYAQGIHITQIDGLIQATGSDLRIARLIGRAGGGSIGASGSIGLLAPRPVDIVITADNARPITSDLVTATLDANLAITGDATTTVTARGRILIRRAEIQVPDKLPASVAVLDVRRPGDKPKPSGSGPGLQIPLDIALDAPQQIFVRGHGLDAEMGGALHIGGTASAPLASGNIALRRGTFSLAGQTLTFTSGDISFNGSRKIDPALDLVATSANTEIAATLTVGGYASAPTITLSSVPDRPQDEILAALLFNQTGASLSPFQLAQIAAALAQVSGIGGGGPDPISRLRKGLGLDRLSVGASGTATGTTPGTGGNSSATTVEAGRYVAPGVFVGAKQGTSGAQTQAEVQIDITKGLKLNSDVGSGPGGNNIGLTYQFQY